MALKMATQAAFACTSGPTSLKFLEPTLHITILLHVNDDEVTFIYFTVSVTLVDKLGCMVGIVHPLSSSRLTTDCQRSWVCW